MSEYNRIQKIWIEAEEWKPGTWQSNDANTDVIVSREDGSTWIASFISYKNVTTVTEKNKRTGECLSGSYFWGSNMLLVDQIHRNLIETIIEDLMNISLFEAVFERIVDD